nr:uncharacterized protein LOC123768669 isoform X4 [Procambarus clarkii]
MLPLKAWQPLLVALLLLVNLATSSPVLQGDNDYNYNYDDYEQADEQKTKSIPPDPEPVVMQKVTTKSVREIEPKPAADLKTTTKLGLEVKPDIAADLKATTMSGLGTKPEPAADLKTTTKSGRGTESKTVVELKASTKSTPGAEPKTPGDPIQFPEIDPERESGAPVDVEETDYSQSLLNATSTPEATEADERGEVPQPTPKPLPASCTQPPSPGLCRGHYPMFYFDPATNTCQQFVYGGCRGNENMHKTATECYAKCHPAALNVWNKHQLGRSSPHDYLTLHDGTGVTSLTFVSRNPSLRVDDKTLAHFSINNTYQFDLYFRTDSPHGLLAFLRQVSAPEEPQGVRIQLYIFLKRGHLAVTHVFDNTTETFIMEKGGLQDSSWHHAIVKVTATTGDLTVEVDNIQENFTVASLADRPGYSRGSYALQDLASRLWIAGVDKKSLEEEEVVVGLVPFHGCMRQVGVASGGTPMGMVPVRPLLTSTHHGVREHCNNNCKDRYRNLCSPSSHCVEHFDHSTCSCFNSGQDGRRCANPELPVLTLNSEGYVVHRIYEWVDRVHSYNNLISIEFKTEFTSSILFYASAEHPEKQHLSASITGDGRIYFEADFGEGVVRALVGERLNSSHWYTFTVIHQHEKLKVYLDSKLKQTLIVPGKVHYLHLDPDLYVGNLPGLNRLCGLTKDLGTPECPQEAQQRYHYDVHSATCRPFNYTGCGGNNNSFVDHATCMDSCYTVGLRSLNSFLGCLRNVFFNDVSILQQLHQGNRSTRYIGMTEEPPLSTTCNRMDEVQVTLSTASSSILLHNHNPNDFRLKVSFRPTTPRSILASGQVYVRDTWNVWQMRHDQNYVYFDVHDDVVHLKPDGRIKIGDWQYVELRQEKDLLIMKVNQMTTSKKTSGSLQFSSQVTIGASILGDETGFIGCLRMLELGGEMVNLRSIVGTPMVSKDVTFDNCQVLGPCERPGSCGHGAPCTVAGDGVQCNCSGTGYTGKTCHFPLYRKSCEQYRQIGYNTSGIYKIDVDGSGPLPPGFVRCLFSELTGETFTIIEHNLPQSFDVRRPKMSSVQIKVHYRDFSDDMLKALVSQSKSCSQKARYNCRRSPLRLSTMTWFSSPSEKIITSFGAKTPGLCRCKEMRSCDKMDIPCNCDANDGLPRADKAVITNPRHLPLTSMVFLQDHQGQREDTEGLITLEPLKCVSDVLEGQTVAFKHSGSFLEVPAWREGSLFLSFKTTSKKAIVAYQPAYHPSHASFKVALVGDKEVEFMYRFRDQIYRHRVASSGRLNTGRWQQLHIDIHDYQMRLVLNSDEGLIDIDRNVNLGVLDGSMFLGAIPQQFLTEEDKQDKLEGFIGCIRGLALNDELVDLKAFVRASANGVSSGCSPSCDPNPCRNGALCLESWGTYQCSCKNPLAHSGRNCENNINEDALTFTTEDSKFKYFLDDIEKLGDKNLLKNSFLINFRTHVKKGLILFAYDYLHNFVQLYLAQENEVVFLYNHGSVVKKLAVKAHNGVVFNKGQSVQLSVTRTAASTTVSVYTDGATFNASLDAGVLLLQDHEYKQFPFGARQPLPEIVYYPHSVTKPTHFFQAYLGSGSDNEFDVTSVIPGIVGCVRGLKIGSKVISLIDLYHKSTFPVDGIKVNCTMACDRRPCLNGGVCTEDFHYFNNFQCDCTGTSYTGPTCVGETSYIFSGHQWISQDAATSPIRKDFRFELAFSTSVPGSRPQLVALLRSTDLQTAHDYLLVAVEYDGSLLVEAQLSDLDRDMVWGTKVIPSSHNFNAFDGHRHYVFVEKTKNGLTLKVDREERDVFPLHNIFVGETSVRTTPTGLYLGGVEAGVDDRLGRFDSFHGCISNVKVRTPDGEVAPLQQYSDSDMHLRSSGVPSFGTCAPFAGAPGALPVHTSSLNLSGVMGEDWAFRTAERVPLSPKMVSSTHPERDTPMDNIVPAVAGGVILVCFIIVIVIVLRTRRKSKHRRLTSDEEEARPLFNGSNVDRQNSVKIVKMSEKEMVPLISKPDHDDVMEGITAGVQAIPAPDVDTRQHEASPQRTTEGQEATTKQEPLDAVQGHLPHEEGSPSSTKVQRRSLGLPFIDDEMLIGENSASVPQMLSYRPLPTEDNGSEMGDQNIHGPDAFEEDHDDKTKDIVYSHPKVGDEEIQKIVNEETEDDIEVVDEENSDINNTVEIGEQDSEKSDNEGAVGNYGDEDVDSKRSSEIEAVLEEIEETEISYPNCNTNQPEKNLKDQTEEKMDKDPELDINDQLELRPDSEPEIKEEIKPEDNTSPESTTKLGDVETDDTESNPQDKEITEPRSDADNAISSGSSDSSISSEEEEFYTEPPRPSVGASSSPKETSEPLDEDDDGGFIELRPEREDIHDARRISAKTLQQFDDHKSTLIENLNMGEDTRPSLNHGNTEDNKGQQLRNIEILVDIENQDDTLQNRDNYSNPAIPLTPIIIVSGPDEHDISWPESHDFANDCEHNEELPTDDTHISRCVAESEQSDQASTDYPAEENLNQEMVETEELTEDGKKSEDEYLTPETTILTDDISYKGENDRTDREETENKTEYGTTNEDEVWQQEPNGNQSGLNKGKIGTKAGVDDTNITDGGKFQTEFNERTEPEGMSEEDWSLLNQQINRDDNSENMKTDRAVIPESEDNNSESYLTFGRDDDISLEDPGVTHRDATEAESGVNLGSVSERDESDKETEAISMPSRRKENPSSEKESEKEINYQNVADDKFSEDRESSQEHKEKEKGKEDDRGQEEEEESGNAPEKKTASNRSNKGHIVRGKKLNPVFLADNLRTFSNPISYLGGPSIEYEEGGQGSRSRSESLTSTSSLD